MQIQKAAGDQFLEKKTTSFLVQNKFLESFWVTSFGIVKTNFVDVRFSAAQNTSFAIPT